MEKYQGTGKIGNIFESEQQVVTNLVIPAGEEIGWHHVDYTVVVVPVKGDIIFSGHDFEEEIKPGSIIRLQPNEVHKLEGVTDSELMVIKSYLA